MILSLIIIGAAFLLLGVIGAFLQANSPIDLGCLPFVGIVVGSAAILFGAGALLL